MSMSCSELAVTCDLWWRLRVVLDILNGASDIRDTFSLREVDGPSAALSAGRRRPRLLTEPTGRSASSRQPSETHYGEYRDSLNTAKYMCMSCRVLNRQGCTHGGRGVRDPLEPKKTLYFQGFFR